MVTSGKREEEGARYGQGINSYRLYKTDKLQGYVVQHREYSKYFIITINGIKNLKTVNYYVIHLKHTLLYINYISIKT